MTKFHSLNAYFTITDGCVDNPCENNGTCVNSVNAYECICEAGFNGTNCTNSTIYYCIVLEVKFFFKKFDKQEKFDILYRIFRGKKKKWMSLALHLGPGFLKNVFFHPFNFYH